MLIVQGPGVSIGASIYVIGEIARRRIAANNSARRTPLSRVWRSCWS